MTTFQNLLTIMAMIACACLIVQGWKDGDDS
jgi:hypothetical protein